MATVQLQPAYVLHARPFRESSQLLEILTRDHGRIGAVARGARGTKSRWRGVLQPFRPLLVSYSRRSDLATLTAADQVAAPPSLMGEALYCGLYLNELTLRLLMRHDAQPEVFQQYRETVAALAVGEDLHDGLRLYEKQLLDASGFGLILDREAGGTEPINPDGLYDYQPERGAVRVTDRARARPDVIPGRVLLSLDAGNVAPEDRGVLRRLMRRVLKAQLGDKPLASEALYKALRQGRSGDGSSSTPENTSADDAEPSANHAARATAEKERHE